MYSRTSSTQFIQYKLRGRRNSIITMGNPTTKVVSEFTPYDNAGTGSNNEVRSFKNASGELIAVKSPVGNIERSSFSQENDYLAASTKEESYITAELDFLKTAYPNEAPYHLEARTFRYSTGDIWSYRLIMPFITGHVLSTEIKHIDEPAKLLTFMLALTLELQRINNLGIIHGDVRYPNILAELNAAKDDYLVHFIDFGSAYFLTELVAVTTPQVTGSALQWAPERRCPNKKPPPCPSTKQDVYSLGYTLKELMNMNQHFSIASGHFKNTFPILFVSIMAMKNEKPEDRPELGQFIEEIRTEMKGFKK